MKLLITGGAGFIGSQLVRWCLSQPDLQVINVDKLTYAGNLAGIRDLLSHPRHVFVKADIGDAKLIRSLFAEQRPDAVLHLAAESHVDRSINDPGLFVQTNIVGTFNLLENARAYWLERRAAAESFRFLQVSTDEVYGSLEPGESAFTESTAYAPRSPYSASKAAADHLAKAWFHTYGLPVIVTNCPNNYGPGQFPEKLIPLAIIKALRGETIPIYGQGENIRDWLYVTDHVRALMEVLGKGRVGETYNIGASCEVRNLDLIRLLCSILDELRPRPDGRPYACQIGLVADRPGHDQRYGIAAAKVRNELGWQPVETLSTGLRQTVQWYLDNEAWWQAILAEKYQLQRLGTLTPAV